MDGDESSMKGRTRGDETFWTDCYDVVDCLYVWYFGVFVCVYMCALLRANVDGSVRGE